MLDDRRKEGKSEDQEGGRREHRTPQTEMFKCLPF